MAFTTISQTPINFANDFANSISQSITANAGDAIILFVRWRYESAATLSSVSWNGQALTQYGGDFLGGGTNLVNNALYWVQASSSATANLVGTFSNYCIPVAMVVVSRPSSGTISASGIQSQIFNSGTFVAPSLSLSSVPTGAAVVSFLGHEGRDTGDNDLTTTFTANSPLAAQATTANNNAYRGTWSVDTASALASSGSVTTAWTRSDSGEPRYVQVSFYLTTGATVSLDSITSPLALGSTGNTITTTGLSTLTSLTVGGKAVSNLSAPSGDGTFDIPAWADGVQGFLLGSGQTVIAGDGTSTATTSVTVNPQTNYTLVTLTSVNTTSGYLGNQVSLSIGDQVIFPTAGSLGAITNYIDAAGGIYTDYAGSQTLYKRDNATGTVTQITLINGQVAPSKFAMLWFFGM